MEGALAFYIRKDCTLSLIHFVVVGQPLLTLSLGVVTVYKMSYISNHASWCGYRRKKGKKAFCRV